MKDRRCPTPASQFDGRLSVAPRFLEWLRVIRASWSLSDRLQMLAFEAELAHLPRSHRWDLGSPR
jgi:hypothetical protein